MVNSDLGSRPKWPWAMMNSEPKIKKFFVKNPVDPSTIISLATRMYEFDCSKSNTLLKTRHFRKILNTILKVVKASPTLKKTVENSIFDVIQSYRTQGGMRVRHAPLKSPLKLRDAIHRLYFSKKSSFKYAKKYSIDKILKNKIAALMALFCSISGRRWIDISRIRWDNMIFCKLEGIFAVKFFISCSKKNLGDRNEGITLIKDDSELCPIKLLIQFWIMVGRPKIGFVFKCIHKNRSYPKSILCDQWLSKRCRGHWMGKKKFSCNGEVNGETVFRTFANEAKYCGFNRPPTKNTFRRLGVIMAHKLNLSRDQITQTFGWKHDSEMPWHYLQDELSTSRDGLAFKLSEKFRKKDFSFLNDVYITN